MGRPLGRLRRLPEIECLFPKTLGEALSLLEKHNSEVKVIAGGTDLLGKMKRRELAPKYLIDLKGIEDLHCINYEPGKGLMIGATATLSEVEESSVVRKDYPILVDALSQMGSIQVRNIGTIVGNLCNAVPSADSAPPLIVLEGRLKIIGPKGERTVLIEDFFTGPEETLLDPLELVTGVEIPPKGPDESGTYLKHTYRGAMDLALVGIAVYLAVDSGKNMCRDIRIAMGAVGPVPIRARKAEEVLRGKALTDDLIETAAKTASGESRPRSFPEYKREMVTALTKRAIKKSLMRR